MVVLKKKKERLDHWRRRESGGAAASQCDAVGGALVIGSVAVQRTGAAIGNLMDGTGARREQGVRECGRWRVSGALGQSPRRRSPIRVSEHALEHEFADAGAVADEQRTPRVFIEPRDVDVAARVEDVVLAVDLADAVVIVIVNAGLVRGDAFEGDANGRCSGSWIGT